MTGDAYTHGAKRGFEAFPVCFGGGDTPEKTLTVVKGDIYMFPGQRLSSMPFLSVTPGKVLNLVVGF